MSGGGSARASYEKPREEPDLAGRQRVPPIHQPRYKLPEGAGLEAVVQYQDMSFGLNNALRRDAKMDPDSKFAKQVELLDAEIRKNSVRAQHLYRALPGAVVKDLSVGDVLSDSAFLSTSHTSMQRWEHMEQERDVRTLRIRVPEGTRGIDMNRVMAGAGVDNPFDYQQEVLLGRNQKMRVTKITSEGVDVVLED
jgi:hypothetical protein